MQLKAFSTIRRASVPVTGGGSVPLTGTLVPFTGDPFPLRASFNSLIVGLGSGAFNCQGSAVSLRIWDPISRKDSARARKKSTKINFLGRGLPREGVEVEKFVPSLESLSSLGFEERNLGCPGNFAGMSRTPGGVRKVSANKSLCVFFVPHQQLSRDSRDFSDSRVSSAQQVMS